MPKLKTHSGTKDRVKISKNGKFRIGHPNTNHFLQKKSAARKRKLTKLETASSSTSKVIRRKLGV
ncbi:MAG TPA: 50S ribosomal protein L35 [Patescibacteria group bacterium]|jgi:large subunit ribosomal protein L35|nr:50S ribosomal protein L35 [Patescibacteria group bacterium]